VKEGLLSRRNKLDTPQGTHFLVKGTFFNHSRQCAQSLSKVYDKHLAGGGGLFTLWPTRGYQFGKWPGHRLGLHVWPSVGNRVRIPTIPNWQLS